MKLLIFLFIIVQPKIRAHGQECGIYSAGVLIQQLTDERMMTSDGLFFDEYENKLYFVNRNDPAVCVLDGKTVQYNCTAVPDVNWISAAIPIKRNDKQLVGLADNTIKILYLTKDKYGKITSIKTETKQSVTTNPEYTFTASKVDKTGRIWIDLATESHDDLSGKVIQVNPDKSINDVIPAAMYPSGIAFSKNNKIFFHVDGKENIVKRYQLAVDTGTIKNPEIIFNITNAPYFEGYVCSVATTDKEDIIWIGVCESGMIIKYNIKTKEYDQVHLIPALYPISLEMGGRGRNVLFIGTSNNAYDNNLNAGQVYAISATSTNGVPSYDTTYH